MNSTLLYFVKLNIAFGLLYLMYRFFLSDDTRLNTRRIFLLMIAPVSFLLPLIEIQWFTQSSIGNDMIEFAYTLDAVTINVEPTPKTTHTTNWPLLFGIVYVSIAAIQLFRMLYAVVQIWRQTISPRRSRKGAFVFVHSDNVTLPYSFFHYIFVGVDAGKHSSSEMEHEMAHASQWHSLDRIIAEITVAFLWINPFIYLWRKAIEELHEFLADQAVLSKNSDWEQYCKHLVASVYQESKLRLTSNFSARILKKRIKMMTREKKYKYWNIAALGLLAVILTFGFACSKELHRPKTENAVASIPKKKNDSDTPYVIVEEMPEYPGGKVALMKFIAKNVKYPEEAKKHKVQGRVFIRFVVKKDGGVDQTTIVRSIHPLLDKEAIRVVELLPKWKPGRQKGEAVDVWYTVPINFQLQGNKNNEVSRPDVRPKFPGGTKALQKFIADNIKYPEEAKKRDIKGRVFVQYTITKDGSIDSIKVVKPVHPLLDNEAIRVIKLLPKWEPAKKDGKAIDVKFTVPINFHWSDKNKEETKHPYVRVDKMPEYPGGQEAIDQFIAANVQYPEEAKAQKIEGRIIVRFVVTEKGNMEKVKVVRSVHPLLDKEAVRVVKLLSGWKPGEHRGKVVKVWYTVVVNFSL